MPSALFSRSCWKVSSLIQAIVGFPSGFQLFYLHKYLKAYCSEASPQYQVFNAMLHGGDVVFLITGCASFGSSGVLNVVQTAYEFPGMIVGFQSFCE